MSDFLPTSILTAREWRLVTTLRAIPDAPVKERALARVEKLLAFAASPCCAEAQADGVPCATPDGRCERCGKALELVDAVGE